MKTLLAFLKDEEGQTSTEYILLVAVAAMLVMKFRKTASEGIDELTKGVFGNTSNLLQELQSGQ